MYSLLLIIVIIVCLCLGLIVLIQNPKGGGLTSNFASSSQLMGVKKTGDFLEKGTWALAIGLMVLSLVINVMVKGGTTKVDSKDQLEKTKELSKPTNSGASTPFAQPQQQAPAPAPGK
ncbi:MAG: preprotein translocase subunit SecG [Sphingobacteriales bacterium]